MLNPVDIRFQTQSIAIAALLGRLQAGQLDVTCYPESAAVAWNDERQSRFIESLLLMIPTPALYVDASNSHCWQVLDGRARLRTLGRFVTAGDMPLTGLEFLGQLEGKAFSGILQNYQRRLIETLLTVHMIGRGTPDSVRAALHRRFWNQPELGAR